MELTKEDIDFILKKQTIKNLDNYMKKPDDGSTDTLCVITTIFMTIFIIIVAILRW